MQNLTKSGPDDLGWRTPIPPSSGRTPITRGQSPEERSSEKLTANHALGASPSTLRKGPHNREPTGGDDTGEASHRYEFSNAYRAEMENPASGHRLTPDGSSWRASSARSSLGRGVHSSRVQVPAVAPHPLFEARQGARVCGNKAFHIECAFRLSARRSGVGGGSFFGGRAGGLLRLQFQLRRGPGRGPADGPRPVFVAFLHTVVQDNRPALRLRRGSDFSSKNLDM
jgi:hypothetical protein